MSEVTFLFVKCRLLITISLLIFSDEFDFEEGDEEEEDDEEDGEEDDQEGEDGEVIDLSSKSVEIR